MMTTVHWKTEEDTFLEEQDDDGIQGNSDTFIEDSDVDTNKTLMFAPGEGQKPLSLFFIKMLKYCFFSNNFLWTEEVRQ